MLDTSKYLELHNSEQVLGSAISGGKVGLVRPGYSRERSASSGALQTHQDQEDQNGGQTYHLFPRIFLDLIYDLGQPYQDL